MVKIQIEKLDREENAQKADAERKESLWKYAQEEPLMIEDNQTPYRTSFQNVNQSKKYSLVKIGVPQSKSNVGGNGEGRFMKANNDLYDDDV